jgi:UDP-N-acetylglucosamine--N-acetylmuramyl-(pentapeptide) pyrophosphoryl-undecaprenol N-acetylglucosamine transferase
LISSKEVDQLAVKSATGVEIFTLPAVALQRGSRLAFARGAWKSWSAARKLFHSRPPCAALAMGGFTSAPPILAAKQAGAKTFLHESNTIPGRANRWLARFVDQAFVGFPGAATRLRVREATVTGTPVRSQFQPRDPAVCRATFGFDPSQPVVLVMGGSQGASGINDMILSVLPLLAKRARHWQWLHLTGPRDADKVKQAYASVGVKAVVRPFLAEMDVALGAASAAVCRAGASSLAELAAMRMPALLVPFPHAADNHQFHNALALAETGAARLLEQKDATPEKVAEELVELVENTAMRDTMKTALARWHSPKAAEQIAEIILREVRNPDFSPLPVASATERRTEVRAPEERQLKAVA